jgi:dipeptidyl aminopeptidase/acylaminoacyl peptidase
VIGWVVPVLLICIAAFFYFRNVPRSPVFYTSVPLTSYVGSEICPSFAPDGQRVAFAWDGEKQDNFDIYVRQIGDGTLLRLTSDPKPDLSPAWSPDGRTIAFLRFNSVDRAEVLLMSSVAASPPPAQTLSVRERCRSFGQRTRLLLLFVERDTPEEIATTLVRLIQNRRARSRAELLSTDSGTGSLFRAPERLIRHTL